MKYPIRNIILLVFMMTIAVGVFAMRLTAVSNEQKAIGLEKIVPRNFGGWSVLEGVIPILPAPEQVELINKIYDETLTRTYVNDRGETVMLSIAYGGEQSGRLKVHRPESCYSGQGFVVSKVSEGKVDTDFGAVPVKRLVAKAPGRNEPITYWIRVGNSTVTGVVGQRLTQFAYSLTGEIPDGLIFRISSISDDEKAAYSLHEKFANALFASLTAEDRLTLAGKLPAVR